MLASTALSVVVVVVVVVVVPVLPLLVVEPAADPDEPPVVVAAVEPPVCAGVSADGPQAADINATAMAATAARISSRIGKRFNASNLGELIDPPRIVGFVRFLVSGLVLSVEQ